jgi:hypothetical protein
MIQQFIYVLILELNFSIETKSTNTFELCWQEIHEGFHVIYRYGEIEATFNHSSDTIFKGFYLNFRIFSNPIE